MKPLVIIGAGGHGRVVAEAAELVGYTDVSFLDDAWPQRETNGDWRIRGRADAWSTHLAQGAELFVALGDNRLRLQIGEAIAAAGQGDPPKIVHPRAIISPRAKIGAGSVVVAGAILQTYAEIGRFSIVNTGATVGHDCRIGDGVHVAPGANVAGTVTVGARSWIGVGSCIRQNLVIGSDVMVGAGAAVVANIGDGLTVTGTPARPVARS